MDYQFLKETDPFLEKVIVLSDKNKNTLGFIPEGAFKQQAKKRCILIATEGDNLAGYLLFRPIKSKHLIGVIHLCIDTMFRKKGVGEGLLDTIKRNYAGNFDGIILKCRKDYIYATKFWERYGFKNKAVKKSTKSENYLCTWHYDFGTGIFQNYTQVNSAKVALVLDANIIIKKQENDFQVKSLFADWLSDEVEFFITSEMRNELNRDGDLERVMRSFELLEEFQVLNANVNDVREIEKELEIILSGTTQNDISDRRQLAECIVSEVEFFITLDIPVLDKAADIYDKYKVNIFTPTEFILEIEQIQNKQIYNPSKLAGANYTIAKPKSNEIIKLIDKFCFIENGEKKHIFRETVSLLTNDISNSVYAVSSLLNEQVAFWGHENHENTINIKFIRIKCGKLTPTLFKQILSGLLTKAVKESKRYIQISDNYLTDNNKEILKEFGFIETSEGFVKIVLSEIISSFELFKKYDFLNKFEVISNLNNEIAQCNDFNRKNQLLFRLERMLFPIKFSDLEIPAYIVPIKFYWASQLFDNYGAEKIVFDIENPELTWNRENVYYRAVNPNIEKESPARILWYISEEREFKSRSKQIVGCSYLDEVNVDVAKKLFKTFKHYGIFKWKDIFRTAKNNPQKLIKALKFSDTEVFEKGVSFYDSIKIADAKNNFQTVTRIDSNKFNKFYELLSKNKIDESNSLNTIY